VLKERLKDGWYDPEMYMTKPKDLQSVLGLGMTLKEIEALPKGKIRTEALKLYELNQAEVKEWELQTKFKNEVSSIVNTSYPGDKSPRGLKYQAFGLLETRNRAEYEQVQLVDTEN
jgi:hypothetical protein